jgi:hypothetical protein
MTDSLWGTRLRALWVGMILALSLGVVGRGENAPLPTATAFQYDKAEPSAFAVYMSGMSAYRGPSWPGSVDTIRIPVTGERLHDVGLEMDAAREAGLDGFTFSVAAMRDEASRRQALDEYADLLKVAEAKGFYIILNLSSNPDSGTCRGEDIKAMARMWFARFGKEPGVPRRDGLPLIMTFAADVVKPQDWAAIFKELAKEGYVGYWIVHFASVMPPGDGKLGDPYAKMVREYLDAGFSGIDECSIAGLSSYGIHAPLAKALFEVGGSKMKTVAMAPFPEYWRTGYAIYVPPDGTALFRSLWESVLQSRANMFDFFSWNDFSEEHYIVPSLLKGTIRSDINRYYLSQVKRTESAVYAGSRVYCTFRRSLTIGEALAVEVLGLPCTAGESDVTIEARSADNKIIKTSQTAHLHGNTLEAGQVFFSTGDFDQERVVLIHAKLHRADGSEISRYVDFVRLLPGFNDQFTTVSHLLEAMPESPALTVGADGIAQVNVPPKCTHVQLLRNAEEIVCETPPALLQVPTGMRHFRLLFTVAEPPTKPAEPAIWRGSLRVEKGIVLRVNNANATGLPPRKLEIAADGSAAFELPCNGTTYPGGFYVDLALAGDGRVVFSRNGEAPVSLSRDDFARKPIIAFQWGEAKALIKRVGGERNYGYVEPMGAPCGISLDIKDLPPGAPTDFYYARAFLSNGAWADSAPCVFRREQPTLTMPYVEEMSFSRRVTKVSADEGLVLAYDFAEDPPELFLVRDSSRRGLHTVLLSGGNLMCGTTGFGFASGCADPSAVKGGLAFDGKNTALVMPYSLSNSCYTVELVVNAPSFGAERTLFTDRRFGGSSGVLAVRIQSDGRIKVSCKKGSPPWADFLSDRPLAAGKRQQITVVNDAKRVDLYLNGLRAGSMESPKGIDPRPLFDPKSDPWKKPALLSQLCTPDISFPWLGHEPDGSGYAGSAGPSEPFLGVVERLRIYCVSLPPAE